MIPENWEAWKLIDKFGDAFFDGKGGIRIEGIRYAIESSDISPENHHFTFQKILQFCVSAIKATKAIEENKEEVVIG